MSILCQSFEHVEFILKQMLPYGLFELIDKLNLDSWDPLKFDLTLINENKIIILKFSEISNGWCLSVEFNNQSYLTKVPNGYDRIYDRIYEVLTKSGGNLLYIAGELPTNIQEVTGECIEDIPMAESIKRSI